MKTIYLSLLVLILLTSCSPRIITRGITDPSSKYILTTSGQKINASSIDIRTTTVIADTTTYSLKSISAVKTGSAYYGVKNSIFYEGVYYGKLMMLRRFYGTSFDMTTHLSHPVYLYYLQKQDKPEILNMTDNNLVKSVRDNPLALRKARAARIYGNLLFISALTTISGLACVFLPYSNPIRKPAVTIGLFSMPVFLVTLPITPIKRNKAVIIYNR